MRQVSGLRYGENPHQPAAFYSDLSLAEHGQGGIATALLHHGKEVLLVCLHAAGASLCTSSFMLHASGTYVHTYCTYVHKVALTGFLAPLDQTESSCLEVAGPSDGIPMFH